MAKRSKEEALQTRQGILDAAIDVFFDRGVASASLNEIAQRANVTRGAIYWHFKNKLDIFSALHEDLQISVADTVLKDLENDHPHPLLQLERLCTELLLDLEVNQRKFRVLSVFYLKCDYSGDMGVFLEQQSRNRQKSLGLFIHYFERAREHNHLPSDIDPSALSVALISYLTGIATEYLRDSESFSMREKAAKFTRIFFRNLG